jgi:hypothetical protein
MILSSKKHALLTTLQQQSQRLPKRSEKHVSTEESL